MTVTWVVIVLTAALVSPAPEVALMVERTDSELIVNKVVLMQEDWVGTYG